MKLRPHRLFALGLVLVGLGVPPMVDAVETAYGLDIRRDVGVLPWYLVTALGTGLFLWHTLRARGPGGRREGAETSARRAFGWVLAALATASVGVLLLGRELGSELVASGWPTVRQAVRGLALFAVDVGLTFASARRPASSPRRRFR